MKNCLHCNKEFKPYDYRAKFCSRSCSATVTNRIKGERSLATKEKISKSLSGRVLKIHKPEKVKIIKEKLVEFNNCGYCNVEFKTDRLHPHKKTCSLECNHKLTGITRKLNISNGTTNRGGGIREGSGRGKSGHYKEFFLNSTYELVYVIYCLDHDIKFERNLKGYSYFDPDRNNWFKFYPDFITDDGLIEIKGYKTKLTEYKLSGVQEAIKVLYKEDLKEMFDYVKSKTGLPITRFQELYDDSKHLYEKICKYCSANFNTSRKTQTVCSNSCSSRNFYKLRNNLANRRGIAPLSFG